GGVEDESDVEKALGEFGVGCLGLGDQVRVPLPGEIAQKARLGARDVDSALARVGDVVQIEDFIIECLEATLGHGDQANRYIQARQPGGSFDQVRNVVQVFLDVGAVADAPDSWDQSDGGIGLGHTSPQVRIGV